MNMVKKEWKNIFTNKVLLISVIAITFIPILYAGFFSKSVWDPYGRAKNLPVAVVNEDRNVMMAGQKVNVGEQLVDNLKSNHDLDWKFVSAKEAEKGMENLDYYMIVTIPEDFSKNATTLLDEKPQKMDIIYKTNGSLNYIGEEISTIGATTLESQVRENVTESYVEVAGKVGKQLVSGITQASDGAKELADGGLQLQNGLGQYTSGVTQADSGANQLADGTNQLSSSVTPLSSGVTELYTGSQQLDTGINELNSKIPELQSGVSQLDSGLQQLSTGSGQLTDGLAQMSAQLNDPTTAAQLDQLTSGLAEFRGIMDEIDFSAHSKIALDAAKRADEISIKAAELQTKLDTIAAELNPEQLKLEITEKINQSSLPSEEKNSLINNINPLIEEHTKRQQETINTLLKEVSGGLVEIGNDLHELSIAAKSVSELPNDASQLDQGFIQIQDGTIQLMNSMNQIKQGVGTANNPASLYGGAVALNSGVDAAYAGGQEMNSQIPTLASGVSQLSVGGDQLATGLGQMYGQMPALASGVNQLDDGAIQLSSGLDLLSSNSPQLLDGINQLDAGSNELADKLGSGAAEGNNLKLNKATVSMFAAPSKLKHEEYSNVSNYGEALSPYIMSLALFVGCLVFNFVFPIRKVSMAGQSSKNWWLSKLSIGVGVALAMAIIEATVMLMLGLTVEFIPQFYLIAIVSSLSYMFIVMFFAMTFDNPGRFIAMVLLVLQLGGAGGTFPMPLTNGFFNAIHPYLPMSYSIYGFRQAISGGIGTDLYTKSVVILAIAFVVFVALLRLSMDHLQKKHLNGISQLDNNQELQAVEAQ